MPIPIGFCVDKTVWNLTVKDNSAVKMHGGVELQLHERFLFPYFLTSKRICVRFLVLYWNIFFSL